MDALELSMLILFILNGRYATFRLEHKPLKPLLMSNVKTREQIASEFGISRKTLYNWLKDEKLPIKGRLVSPKEQKVIYDKFGKPNKGRNKWADG